LVGVAHDAEVQASLTDFSNTLTSPGDIAVDRSGDVWVPSAETKTVVKFTAAELAKSVSQPAVTVAGPATGLIGWWAALAIEP
jgi:hypothetical protein